MNPYKLTAQITTVVMLALPAAASAHEKVSTQSVRAHIRSADQALALVAERVEDQQGAAAAIAIVANRRQTQAATRESARLRGSARASSMRLVAKQRNANAETYAELVGVAPPEVQDQMAAAVTSNLHGRELALETLSALLPSLPAKAQPAIARAIAALSGSGLDEVGDITAALQSGNLGEVAEARLTAALSVAAAAIDAGLGRLQAIVPSLPAVAQGPVQVAIARVTGILQALLGGVGSPAAEAPAPGAPASVPSILSGLLPGLPIPSGLPVGGPR